MSAIVALKASESAKVRRGYCKSKTNFKVWRKRKSKGDVQLNDLVENYDGAVFYEKPIPVPSVPKPRKDPCWNTCRICQIGSAPVPYIFCYGCMDGDDC